MTSPYRSTVSFQRLVTDCWGILQETKEAIFPRGSRAAPSPVVYVVPPQADVNFGYYWEFWKDIATPSLEYLAANPPPYTGGWGNSGSKAIVEATLRSAVENSPKWSKNVNFST